MDPQAISGDASALAATPARLRALAQGGAIDRAQLEAGLARTDARATGASWAAFANRYILTLGVVLLAAGVIFFFAANWSALHPWARLAIVAAGIVGSAAAALRLGLDALPGRMAVLLAALLIGPLFAVYGQAYQTGADSFELFVAWTVLATPFALLARLGGLWLFWLVLANTAVLLRGLQLGGDGDGAALVLQLAALNAVFLAVWERLRAPGRIVPRAGALLLLVPLLTGMTALITGDGDDFGPLPLQALTVVATAAALAGLIVVYQGYRPDLFPVAVAGFACAYLVSVLLGQLLFDVMDLEVAGLFLLGSAILAQVWWLARTLLRLRRQPPHGTHGEEGVER